MSALRDELSDLPPTSDAPHFTTIGKALKRLKQQFEEAYLDDHKLIVDDGKYDESHLEGLRPDERAKLQLRQEDRPRARKGKYKKDDDSDQPWSAAFQKRQARKQLHQQQAAAFELTGNPELDMIVDPIEFPRIMDLVHAKQHLDRAQAAFLEAFEAGTPLATKERLTEMLEHLGKLDGALGYTKTDPDTGAKTMKGPLVEYKMDGEIIAKALSEISTTLSDHLGIKNQLANELRDDPLLGKFLR